MPNTLPIVAPNLPCIFRLDIADTAIEDFHAFNQKHIAFVLLGNISIDKTHQNRMLRIVNTLCASPLSDDRLKAIWIQDGEMLEKLTPELIPVLKAAFPGKLFEKIQAFSTPLGNEVPSDVIEKGSNSFSMTNIRKAMNLATIATETPPIP